MKNIVILGAGFGGVTSALGLAKKFSGRGITITLIDFHDYHLFTPNLYEVATSDEEFTSVDQLKKSIALPLKEIFAGTKVKIVKAKVSQIHPGQKFVIADEKKFAYDYLILGAGAISDYFNIEGAQQFAMPLKSLKEAFAIRNQIEFAVQTGSMDVKKKNLRVIVAGGGYTGVELAGEMAGLLNILAWKYQYPREKIEVLIVEASPALIPGFSERLSIDAYLRLKRLGVRCQLSSAISKVERNFIELASGDRLEYDVLIWTAGVKAQGIPFAENLEMDKKGRVITNQFLQAKEHENIFVLGDVACIMNSDHKPAPPTAQDAAEQGQYVAYALPLIIKNQSPKPYSGKKHGYIVAIGGEWAIMNYAGFYFTGSLGYIFRELANLNYFRKIIGWWRAVKLSIFDMEIYSRND